MQNQRTMRAVMAGAIGTATAILLAVAMNVVVSGQTMANQAIAQKTSQPCAKCHSAPPALNDYGKKYKESMKK
jgi:hypothetical protein